MESYLPKVRPWIRFWARTFDTILFAVPLVAMFQVAPKELRSAGNPVLFPLTASMVAALLEAVLLSTWGWTPGKWLLGVQVRDAVGGILDFTAAFERTLWVWVRGMACGFWPAQLITQPLAWFRLKSKGVTSWDEQAGTRVFHRRVGFARGTTVVAGLLGLFVLATYGELVQTMARARQRAQLVLFERARKYETSMRFVEAALAYRRAADTGLAAAQNNLGNLYASGFGLAQSDVEAVQWYRRAADQGLASAQYNLGIKYLQGRGVPRDSAEALKWLTLAAGQGQAEAAQQIKILVPLLSPDVLNDGQRRASQFVSSHGVAGQAKTRISEHTL